MAPDLGPGERARREALEVLRFAEGVLGEQLGLHPLEPLTDIGAGVLSRHRGLTGSSVRSRGSAWGKYHRTPARGRRSDVTRAAAGRRASTMNAATMQGSRSDGA